MSFPINDSKCANPEHRIVVGMGQSRETKWHEARDASDATTLYPAESAPISWTGSIVGLRRIIIFFDTSGVSQDLTLKVTCGDTPAGSGSVYVLNGNGADYNFGDEIYSWILGRFSAEYLITSKALSDIVVGSNYFPIPASHINSSGYTVVCLVLSQDYDDTFASGSAKLQAFTGQLKLPSKGYIWVEGTSIAYVDTSEAKLLKEGTTTGNTGTAGYIWVEGNNLHYIDSSGNERYIAGTQGGATGQTAGHMWLEGTELHYIDSSGNERYFEGI